MLGGVPRAGAVEPQWPAEPYEYIVVDQDLSAVLQEFGNHLGMAVQIGDDVRGRVRGRLPPMAPKVFLERLSKTYGLAWYYDGSVLSVVSVKSIQSRLIPLGATSFERLSADLDRLQISDARFPLRHAGDANAVLVSGPPRYVELVEQAIGVAAERPKVAAPANRTPAASDAGNSPDVRVFRGQRLAGS